MFLKEKRGLSAVVVTLMLVLLSVVAVAVVWVVISGILQSSESQIGEGTKCLDVSVTATKVVNTSVSGDAYNITLKRTSTGKDIGGVKVVLFSDDTNSEVVDISGNIAPLATETKAVSLTTAIPNANKIEVTPYLTSADGSTACATTTFTF